MSKQPTEEEAINALVVEIRVLESTYNELSSRQSLLERALVENREPSTPSTASGTSRRRRSSCRSAEARCSIPRPRPPTGS